MTSYRREVWKPACVLPHCMHPTSSLAVFLLTIFMKSVGSHYNTVSRQQSSGGMGDWILRGIDLAQRRRLWLVGLGVYYFADRMSEHVLVCMSNGCILYRFTMRMTIMFAKCLAQDSVETFMASRHSFNAILSVWSYKPPKCPGNWLVGISFRFLDPVPTLGSGRGVPPTWHEAILRHREHNSIPIWSPRSLHLFPWVKGSVL